jgi:phosphate transport system permease protein
MTDQSNLNALERLAANKQELLQANLKRRYRKELRFKLYGIGSLFMGGLFLSVLLFTIISSGYKAFLTSYVELEIKWDAEALGIYDINDPDEMRYADYEGLVKDALKERFPGVSGRQDRRKLYSLVSSRAGYTLRDRLIENPELLGTSEKIWLLADDEVDAYYRGHTDVSVPEDERRFQDIQVAWVDELAASGAMRSEFNTIFFTAGDSREPEQAGIKGAAMGSLYTLLVTLILSFPIGVAAAIYLEEFAPKNRFTDLIEININNLAAVPSIVFGLLGLAVFLNFFNFPRSAPLVGGMVLTLMTLPTIIIASRAAIKAVPPSIREAALGLGSSKMQMVMHHVLPLALPGMLTGAIIGMAQALGETAPLLMIGMVAFIVDIPGGPMDPATVLPVQIFLWSDLPERAFVERTSAAIMVLLMFLALMNAFAVFLRKRFERQW